MACARALSSRRYTRYFRRGNASLRRPDSAGFELKAIRKALEHSSYQRETAQARSYR